MAGAEGRCLRCGGTVEGGHPASRRGICVDCARTIPVLAPRGLAETEIGSASGLAPGAAGGPSGFRLPDPGTDLGGIVIEGTLGRGGMGSVLSGRDTRLERRVAVKFLREGFAGSAEFTRRFRKEGAALAQIAHPHVVRVFAVG